MYDRVTTNHLELAHSTIKFILDDYSSSEDATLISVLSAYSLELSMKYILKRCIDSGIIYTTPANPLVYFFNNNGVTNRVGPTTIVNSGHSLRNLKDSLLVITSLSNKIRIFLTENTTSDCTTLLNRIYVDGRYPNDTTGTYCKVKLENRDTMLTLAVTMFNLILEDPTLNNGSSYHKFIITEDLRYREVIDKLSESETNITSLEEELNQAKEELHNTKEELSSIKNRVKSISVNKIIEYKNKKLNSSESNEEAKSEIATSKQIELKQSNAFNRSEDIVSGE